MDHSFESGQPLQQQAAGAQRQAPRDAMFLHTDIRHAGGDGAVLTLRVRNLSAGGMMVETAEPFVRGDALRVTLRNIGELAAKVAWVREGRIGISFDRPIDPRDARKASPKSPGSTIQLVRPEKNGKRPGIRGGRG